jgi:site-specific DNA-adenine methylase
MSLISYFGGKSSSAFHNFINPQIPREGVKKYLEPFSGSFATYMDDKTMNFPEVYYNDFNNHQMNLYKCGANPELLLDAIDNMKNTLLSNDLTDPLDKWDFYKDIYKEYTSNDFLDFTDFSVPDYEKAAIYAFLITSSFSSVYPRGGGFTGYKKKEDKLKLEVLINKLKKGKYTEKLQAITEFTSVDFEELIRKHDADDTYIYLDPPYFRPDENGEDDGRRLFWYGSDKEGVFGAASHRRLLNLLKETKSRWSLSYYYFPLLEELLPRDQYRWIEKEVNRPSAQGGNNSESKKDAGKGVELLIMNYDENGTLLSELNQSNKETI